MRKTHTTQLILLESDSRHKLRTELKMISQRLDEHQEALLDLVQQDLVDPHTEAVGRLEIEPGVVFMRLDIPKYNRHNDHLK